MRSAQLSPAAPDAALPTQPAVLSFFPDRRAHRLFAQQEKMDSIRAYGAELMVVEDGVDYMDEANRLATENGWYDVDQYDNPANSIAHEQTMAPELWAQTEGTITHFVAGGSTGGTLSGVGRGLKAVKPDCKIVLADPVGSVFAPMFETGELVDQGKFLVEGVGKGNIRALTPSLLLPLLCARLAPD